MFIKFLVAACAVCFSLCSPLSVAAGQTENNLLTLSGARSQYQLTATASGFTITDLRGKEAQRQVSRATLLQFADTPDTTISLDMEGKAGQVYRLYQAAFNRTPDLGGLGFWIDVMNRNVSLYEVASAFIRSPEFLAAYGGKPGEKLGDEAFVEKIYQNILHRAPEPGGMAYWVGVLKIGELRQNVLANISESPENKALLQNAISQGIEFAPMPVAGATAGVWEGATNTGRKLAGVVLDNGSFWLLYSKHNDFGKVAGVVVGSGNEVNQQFTSTRAYDFNLEGKGILATDLSASIVAQKSFNGNFSTLAYEQNVNFTSNFNTQYTQAPSLASVAGTYAGLAFQRNFQSLDTLQIHGDGSLNSTILSSCKTTGSIVPRKNIAAYHFTLNFGGAPCHAPNTTVTGLAYYDVAARQFYALSINDTQTDGFVFAATKL